MGWLREYLDRRARKADATQEEAKRIDVEQATPKKVVWFGEWQQAKGSERWTRPVIALNDRGFISGMEVQVDGRVVAGTFMAKAHSKPGDAIPLATTMARDWLQEMKSASATRSAHEVVVKTPSAHARGR